MIVQVLSLNASFRQKVVIRTQDAMIPLDKLVLSAYYTAYNSEEGVIYTVPAKNTNIRPDLRFIEAFKRQTVGIGRIKIAISVAMFGTLDDL